MTVSRARSATRTFFAFDVGLEKKLYLYRLFVHPSFAIYRIRIHRKRASFSTRAPDTLPSARAPRSLARESFVRNISST